MPHSLRRGPEAAAQKLVRSHHVRAMFRGHHSLPCCLKGCCAKPIRAAVQGASAAMDTKCMHQRQSALQHMMNHRWVSLSMLAKENSVATTQPIFRTQQSSSASEIINHSLLLPRCNKTCCCACQRKSGAACSAMLSMIAHHVRGGGGAKRGVRSMCAAACGSTVAATNASDANIILPTRGGFRLGRTPGKCFSDSLMDGQNNATLTDTPSACSCTGSTSTETHCPQYHTWATGMVP